MDTVTLAPGAVRRAVDASLAAAWDGLADRTAAVPFARPGWLLLWAESAGARLEALTLWRGSRLAGILPVIAERRRLRTPGDWHTPWMEAVAEDDAALSALTGALAAARRSRVTVDFVPAGGPTAAAATASLEEAGYRLSPRPRLESPFLAVAGTWEQYLASLSAHRRSELRRRNRKLEAAGTVAREVHDGNEGLPRLLDEAFAVEFAGWKGRGGTAIASDPAVEQFYRRVASWAAERGWLRVAGLRLDGRLIAFDLALEAGGSHYLLKTGYDPAFTALSPGMLLRVHMIERAFALGLESYEFCGAAEPWKLEWAPTTRQVLAIEAFAPTPAGSLARIAFRGSRFARVRTARLRVRPR
jgi:CelD/BcsL family acetyltransferase involved in cellulose biosynthesis